MYMLQKYYQSCFWPAEVNVTKVVLKHIFISLTKNCIVKLEFKNMDCYLISPETCCKSKRAKYSTKLFTVLFGTL